MEVIVVFRKYPDTGNVIALLPEWPGKVSDGGYACDSYMHVGQHGAADPVGVVGDTVPATPAEYADLKTELESLGYVVRPRKRITHAMTERRRAEFKRQADAVWGTLSRLQG